MKETTHEGRDRHVAITADTNAVPGKAKKLALRSDQQTGPQRRATSEELLFYNTLLKDRGKRIADKWLNERWA